MGSSGSRWDAGVATIVSSGHISVPLVKCLETVLDTSTYPKWYKFVCHVEMQKPFQVAESDLPFLALSAAARDRALLPGGGALL